LSDRDAGAAARGGLFLKPRGIEQPVLFPDDEVRVPPPSSETPIEEAEYVALDVETTGNTPFLVIGIGAERFRLAGTLSLFDTLVHTRAPINTYARRRHQISRDMLEGAPEFPDARRAFLHFARGAVLVEHSHDAFDSYLIGRGLRQPLENPVIDTSTLSRLVLDLPMGQTPGLARVVEELGLDASPAHAALGDAQATAAVFRELAGRARERFGWTTVGHLLVATDRPPVDRSAIEGGPSHGARRPRKGSSHRERTAL
jgi:DNA polymerase-3 subunit epsilon